MIKIKFYSLIRLHLGINEIQIEADKISIYDLLQIAEKQLDKLLLHLLINADYEIIPGTMILINGRNIFHLKKLDTIVQDGDVVSIFPPGGGG
ncbi:MAG: MoaD family protein [Candidatus Cloacimonetes bacterium]|nr:MoaD family protein [Candidatus Cloacimonadota bacterium]